MNRWFDCNFNYNKHCTNVQSLSFRCSTPEIMHSVKLPKLVRFDFASSSKQQHTNNV